LDKNKKTIRRIAGAIFAAILFFSCYVIVQNFIQHKGEYSTELYYMMSTGNMKSIDKTVYAEENVEAVEALIHELQFGTKPEGAISFISEQLEIRVLALDDNTVYLALSPNYYELNGADEVITRSALVWSLTSLEFVENVTMFVEGMPVVSKTGDEYGLMNRQNVLIDTAVSAITTEYAILKLYFSDENATGLIIENRMVEVDANQPRERTILEQLILGPSEEGYYATIPPETKIRDVTTTEDGICYVNLSQEFVTKHAGGSTGELFTTYSIVNSLCELNGIEKVQFLVEGEKLETYKGHLDFSVPFESMEILQSID